MELVFSLENLANEKLLNLHAVAGHCNDPNLVDFVESEFLTEQVEAINKISNYVAQLRRIGKGHGTAEITLFRVYINLLPIRGRDVLLRLRASQVGVNKSRASIIRD